MRRRANALDYIKVMVKGVPALFTDARIERESVPDGFYLYEVRYDDENLGDPAQIGKCVIVNFLGSLLVSEELELPWNGYLDIDLESDWETGEFIGTLKEGVRSVKQMIYRNTIYLYPNGRRGDRTLCREWT